jgi:hypothetical protein
MDVVAHCVEKLTQGTRFIAPTRWRVDCSLQCSSDHKQCGRVSVEVIGEVVNDSRVELHILLSLHISCVLVGIKVREMF